MSAVLPNQLSGGETREKNSSSLLIAGGAATLAMVALIMLDMGLTFAGGDRGVGMLTAVEWFEHLQSDGFLALRNLGIFNVINAVLTLPLYMALFQIHRDRKSTLGTFALIVFIIGAAVYIANNRALAMLHLSSQYAAASSEAYRSLLAETGTAVMAQGEDFTPGTFPGFFLLNAASIMMLVVMLSGSAFRKGLTLAGLVGSVAMLLFTTITTFMPARFDLAMIFAVVGGLLIVAWQIYTAVRLLQLGRTASKRGVERVAPAGLTVAEPGKRSI